MKPTPHNLAVMNNQRVTRANEAKQKAADAFRQRQIDAALRRVLKALVSEEVDHPRSDDERVAQHQAIELLHLARPG